MPYVECLRVGGRAESGLWLQGWSNIPRERMQKVDGEVAQCVQVKPSLVLLQHPTSQYAVS